MRSLSPAILASGLCGMLFLSACHAQGTTTATAGSDGVVAVVNGEPIKQSTIDAILKTREEEGQKNSPEVTTQLKQKLIETTLMAQAAESKGLDKQPDVANELALTRESILARAYVNAYIKANPISDDKLRAEYNRLKANFGGNEYRVSHILVKTEKEAKDIIAQLDKGADFAKLAKADSMDPGSKSHGGDLSWVTPNALVKPFADAMVKLPKGKYTEQPVQTQFGWHIIKMDDIRPLKAPDFEAVKPQLMQRMQGQQMQDAIIELRQHAKIEDGPAAK